MLSKVDRKKILDLRSQDYSYQSIHNELGFAKDTIMKYCQREKKQKNQEKKQKQGEITNSNDPITKLRRISSDIDNFIETGKLNERDQRKLLKQNKEIKAILKSEVDDRISNVEDDAIEKNDKQWRKYIELNYVRKEEVVNLKNDIKEKDNIIKILKI